MAESTVAGQSNSRQATRPSKASDVACMYAHTGGGGEKKDVLV